MKDPQQPMGIETTDDEEQAKKVEVNDTLVFVRALSDKQKEFREQLLLNKDKYESIGKLKGIEEIKGLEQRRELQRQYALWWFVVICVQLGLTNLIFVGIILYFGLDVWTVRLFLAATIETDPEFWTIG